MLKLNFKILQKMNLFPFNKSQSTKHSISFLLILSMFILGLNRGYAQTEPDDETLRLSPFTSLDTPIVTSPCLPKTIVLAAHVLNFQTKSVLYLNVQNPEFMVSFNSVLFLQNSQVSTINRPFSQTEGYMKIELPSNARYQLLGQNTCGTWVPIYSFSTFPKSTAEPIKVSERLGNALSRWKSTETVNPDLKDFLQQEIGISRFEQDEFLQNFVGNGKLISDAYVNSLIPKGGFTPDGPTVECTCRVLNISLTSEVYPTSSGQLDPMINPQVFPNSVIEETNRYKLWHAGSFEGPARYQQIWGETKKCRNVTEGAIWGSGSADPLSNALGRAVIRIEQLCKSGDWTKGLCYCRQNITFRYKYDAQLDARSGTRSGACFNPPGKKAQAIVDDCALVMIARRNNPTDPSTSIPIFTDVKALGVVSSCNKDFQEKRILDVLSLGLAVYGYIKGFPIDFKNPVANDVSAFVYDEYNKSLFKKSLENLLTEPWVKGNCEQKTGNYTLDNINGVGFPLEGTEALVFSLSAASHLEVSGMTAWDANARVLSGFSMSVVVEKKENVTGSSNAYCCTKPAGIYQTSTLHPIQTQNTYNQVIGAHLSPQLACCAPISPVNGQVIISDDRNIIIGSLASLICETTINERNSQSRVLSDVSINVVNGSVVLEGLQPDIAYLTELFTIDGRRIYSNTASGNISTTWNTSEKIHTAGIYILRVSDGTNNITKKIFLQ